MEKKIISGFVTSHTMTLSFCPLFSEPRCERCPQTTPRNPCKPNPLSHPHPHPPLSPNQTSNLPPNPVTLNPKPVFPQPRTQGPHSTEVPSVTSVAMRPVSSPMSTLLATLSLVTLVAGPVSGQHLHQHHQQQQIREQQQRQVYADLVDSFAEGERRGKKKSTK